MRKIYLVLFFIVLIIVGCKFMKNKNNFFAVVYGKINPESVASYKMIIVDPDHYSRAEIQEFQDRKIKVIAYLSLGEVDSSRWYFPYLDKEGLLLGRNPYWNAFYLNLASPEVKKVLFNKVLPNIMIKGFDGLFFDTVDDVAPYGINSHLQKDMIEIIERIRGTYPKIFLIMNGGLFLLDKVATNIDAILVEDVASRYDFSSKRYSYAPEPQFMEKIDTLMEVYKKYKLPIFVVDYADNVELAQRIEKRLSKYNVYYYISTIDLTKIPEYK